MRENQLVPGKFPESLLSSFLKRIGEKTDRLATPPAAGEDTGAAELDTGDLLVYTADPITMTASRIGRSSVIINANDIATSGGTPQWFLATLLVPPGYAASRVTAILDDIAQTCRTFNISLAGGHTEITGAVNRPVVSGSMFTIVKREQYIDKKNAGTGDAVILTKTAGIEGTAVLAEDLSGDLQREGLSTRELDEARRFFDDISVVREAAIAVESGGVTAMHDVTEGGVATALRELSTAAGRGLLCKREAIPIHPLTEKICSALKISPYGLLGSGSLLICCKSGAVEKIIQRLQKAEIYAAVVGTIGNRGSSDIGLPEFETDEINKVL